MDISTTVLSFVAKQRLHVECTFKIYDSEGNFVDVQDTFFDVPKDDSVTLSLYANIDDLCMYTSIDVVNVRSDYLALKESFKQLSKSFEDVCCLMDRLEYFLGHFEDSALEDDLPV